MAETNPYLQPDTPEADNPYLQPDTVEAKDRGLIGNAMAGAAHGIWQTTKKQIGETEQFAGRGLEAAGLPIIGQAAQKQGAGISQAVDNQNSYTGSGLSDNDQQSLASRTAYGLGEGVSQMTSVGAAGAAAGALAGAAFGGIGALPGAALGWAIANVAALPTLIAGSTGEGTAEKVEKQALADGKSADDAKSEAFKAGSGTAAVAGAGGAAVGLLGPLGKSIGFVGKAAEGSIVRSAVEASAEDVAQTAAKTPAGRLAQKVGNVATSDTAQGIYKAGAEGAGVMGATSAANAEIEQQYGVGQGATWADTGEAALSGGLLTGAMHAVPGYREAGRQQAADAAARKSQDTLQDPQADPAAREQAALGVMGLISTRDQDLAKGFGAYAQDMISQGKPIEFGDDSLYHNYADQKAAADAATAANVDQLRQQQSGGDQAFQPGQDNAGQNAPANIYDPTARDNTPVPPVQQELTPTTAAPDSAPPFRQTYEEIQANAPRNMTDVVGGIFGAANGDEAIRAFEDSVNRGTSIGVTRTPVIPDFAETERRNADPSMLGGDLAHFQQVRDQAANDVRDQNYAHVQALQGDTLVAPPVHTDPFEQRRNQLQHEAETLRQQGLNRMALEQQASPENLARLDAQDQTQLQAEEQRAQAVRDQVEQQRQAGEQQAADTTAQRQAVDQANAPTVPTTALAKAKPDAELNPMEFALRRGVQELGRRKLENLTTEQLKQIVDHHPDADLSARATDLYNARRNKANIEQAYVRPGQETVLDNSGKMAIPEKTPPVEFSEQARDQNLGTATPLEGATGEASTAEAKAKAPSGLVEGPDGTPIPVKTMEQTDPSVRKLKGALESDGRLINIRPVDRAELPDTTQDNGKPGYEKQLGMSKADYDLHQKVAGLFGAKVQTFAEDAKQQRLNGVMMPSEPNKVYVNAKAQVSHIAVVGHELSHSMETMAPEIHKAMKDAILKGIDGGGLEGYAKKYGMETKTEEGRNRVTNEIVADLVGNRYTELGTWRHVFANVDKSNPSMVYRIADFITQFINKLMRNEKFTKFATDDMITDLMGVKNAVRRGLSEFANSEGRKPLQHDAEQLRAMKENIDKGTSGEKAFDRATTRMEAEPRADVGKAEDRRAPAPTTERDTTGSQGSREVEKMRGQKAEREAALQPEPTPKARPEGDDTGTAHKPVDEPVKVVDTVKTAEDKADATQFARENNGRAAVDRARQVDPTKDTLTQAIAKLGGINRREVESEWGMGHAAQITEGMAGRVARAQGHSIDDMTTKLQELGYLKDTKDPRGELEDKFIDSVSGVRQHFTDDGAVNDGQRRQQMDYEDWHAQQTPDVQKALDDVHPDDRQMVMDHVEQNYDDLTGKAAADAEQQYRDYADELDRSNGEVAESDDHIPFDAGTTSERDSGGGRSAEGESQEDFLKGESKAEGEARLQREAQAQAAEKQRASDAERKAKADAEGRDFKLTGSDRDADRHAAEGQQDLLMSRMRHPDLHENLQAVRDNSEEISHDDAAKMVRGATGKEHGIDPEKWIKLGSKDETLLHGDIPLDQFAENREGRKYDSTVDDSRLNDYASRDGKDAPPVIGVMSRSSGKVEILDGGHRLSAARARGDDTINAVVKVKSGTEEAAAHAQKVAESSKQNFWSEKMNERKAAEMSPAMGKVSPEQAAALARIGAVTENKTKMERWKEFSDGFWKRMQQGIFDQYAPIKRLSMDAYTQVRMAKGVAGTLEAMMMYGKPKIRDGVYDVDIKDTGFAKVLSRLDGEHDRFFQWIAANRAERLKAEGKENLYTNDDISILKTLNQNDDAHPQRMVKFEEAEKAYNEFNESISKIAVDSGMMSKEQADIFKGQPYVPFYRTIADTGDMPAFTKSGGLVNQYAFKTLKGGTDKLNKDLLANVLQNWSHILEASAKNRAMDLAMKEAVKTGIAQEVNPNIVTKGTVRVKVDGSDVHYVVSDPHMMTAITAMSSQVPTWMAPISKFKRLLTSGVTLTPGFKIRNLIRDTVSAMAIDNNLSMNPYKNLTEGWKGTDEHSQTYASMLASGGVVRMGTMLEGNEALRAHKLVMKGVDKDTILDNPASIKKLWDMGADVFDRYKELGDRGENVNRAALYQQMMAMKNEDGSQKYTHAQASFAARDLMDFSMQGSWPVVRFLTQSVPFLNARLQGLYKLGSQVDTAAGRKRLALVLGSVALASMGLLMQNKDDPDWKAREDFDRDNYWWFKIGSGPLSEGNSMAFRIPKPFEVGAIGTVAERTMELSNDPEMTGDRYMQRVGSLVMQQFSLDPTPQIVKPLMDVYANKDGFTGRPIEGQALQKLQSQDRYTPGTSAAARLLGSMQIGGHGLPNPMELIQGRYSNLSPVQIDSLLHGYFGTVGTYALAATDMAAKAAMDGGSKPSGTWSGFTGGMVDPGDNPQSRYVTQVYDNLNAIEEAHNSYQMFLKTGQRDKAQEMMKDEQPLLSSYTSAEAVKRQMSQLSAQEKRIQADKQMSSDEKRQKLNDIERRLASTSKRLDDRLLQRGVAN